MSRRSDSKNTSQITSLGGPHDDLRLVWMAQYICKCFPDIPDGKSQFPKEIPLHFNCHFFPNFSDAVRWYFKENKKMFRDMLDEKVVFKSLFFQNIYDPSKDERRLKKLEREAAQRKAQEEAQDVSVKPGLL